MPTDSIITIDFTNTNIIVTDGPLTKCTGSIYFTSVSTDYTCIIYNYKKNAHVLPKNAQLKYQKVWLQLLYIC